MPRPRTRRGTPYIDLIDRYIIVNDGDGVPDYKYFDNVGDIVRCVECKHYEPRLQRCHEGHVAAGQLMKESDYCSRGERVEDGL